MSLNIYPIEIKNEFFTVNAMAFIPALAERKDSCALFTHGYTASKTDCVNWAQRLSQVGVPTIIFDQPGHYLGSFNECESFETFKQHSQNLFIDAFKALKSKLNSDPARVIIGGHSLGALQTIRTLENSFWDSYDPIGICIGFGIGQHKTKHLFETSFYQKTLEVRRQLVSPSLDSDQVFSWINHQKLDMKVKQRRLHLITGKDDVVVGEGGMEALEFVLKENNQVTSHEPTKLPHHEPALASTHIYSFLRKELNW